MSSAITRLIAALSLCGLIAVACASPAPQPTATTAPSSVIQVPGAQVSTSGDQVTIKGADGKSVTIDSNVPPELKDFPVPTGFKSEGAGSMSVGGDKLAATSWKGTGQLQAIVDFYKSSLPAQGWKEDSVMTFDDNAMVNYSKPGGLGLTLTVTKEEGNNITVAVLMGKSSATPTPRAQSAPTPQSQAKAAPEVTPTPEPTQAPQAPKTTDASALPAELKDIPVPSGFAPVKDKTVRMATGGQFQMAMAEFFGKASVKDATAYYKSTLPGKGWNIDVEAGGEDEQTFVCSNKADSTLMLSINISTEDAGTTVYVQLAKQ